MHHAVGSDQEGIAAGAIAAGDLPLTIRIEKAGDGFVAVLPESAKPTDAAVWLLPVLHSHTVEIGRGENRGTSITYVNIVRGITHIGDWTGASISFPVPSESLKGEAGDADSFVILLQQKSEKKQGAILGAAKAPGF